MVEPLLHFIVPFTAFRATGVDWRRCLFASVIALTPDLDVLFHVHRSLSHSLLVVGLIALPILALTYRNNALRNLTYLGVAGVLTHLALDLFQGYTPLLYPLVNSSFWVSVDLQVRVSSLPILIPSVKLLTQPVAFSTFQTYLGTIITPAGLGISLTLLAPTLAAATRHHLSRN